MSAIGGIDQVRPAAASSASGADASQTIVALMKKMQDKIVHKDDIVHALSAQFDKATIQRAIERLLDDGTIYTAHSNDTFMLDA
jgi:Replication protein A C terminal